MRRENVYVSQNEIASVDHIMFLIARLPYLDMLDFAGLISGDADKIADAARDWFDERAAKEAVSHTQETLP